MSDYLNENGVRIVRCCASCRHHAYDRGMKPLCMKGNSALGCRAWAVKDNLQNVGKSSGGVKKIEYLRFAIEKECPLGMKPEDFVTGVRAEWQRGNGTIYEIEP